MTAAWPDPIQTPTAQTCRATTLPCCFSCPAPICQLVDIHGALDNSTPPAATGTGKVPSPRRRGAAPPHPTSTAFWCAFVLLLLLLLVLL